MFTCCEIQDDLKDYGRERGYCPYFLARHAVSKSSVCREDDIFLHSNLHALFAQLALSCRKCHVKGIEFEVDLHYFFLK